MLFRAALSVNGGTGSTTAGNGGTVQLKTANPSAAAGTITQSAQITATGATGGSLKVTSSDDVTLQTITNDVAKVAANVTVANKALDRKSTRLNSSHQITSYAVFCSEKNMPSGADAQQALKNG